MCGQRDKWLESNLGPTSCYHRYKAPGVGATYKAYLEHSATATGGPGSLMHNG